MQRQRARRLGVLDDWLFAPVNLPKASPLSPHPIPLPSSGRGGDKLEQFLEQLGKARGDVVAVLNDLALPGYVRPELAEAAVMLTGVVKRLETMYRVPNGFEAAVARRGNFNWRRGEKGYLRLKEEIAKLGRNLGRKGGSKSKSTIKSKDGRKA